MGNLTTNKKVTEENMKKAEFEFMLDLKTLISKTAVDPELTRGRSSMRREDQKTATDGLDAKRFERGTEGEMLYGSSV